jgi:glycosyltransferase involved in cell wall biosynthesis
MIGQPTDEERHVPADTPITSDRPPIRVVGYLSAAFGLGIAAGNTVRVLRDSGRDVSVVDIDPGSGRFGRDRTWASLEAPERATGPAAIDVFHMNPPEVPAFHEQWRRRIRPSADFAACVPFWELPVLPASWTRALDCFDLVLAPTEFVRDACEAALARPVLHYPQAVFVPEDIRPDRERFGIPGDATAFLVAFDVESDMSRKNPFAAIDAFRRAFGDSGAALLVIKVNASQLGSAQQAQLDRLATAIEGLPNVRLIQENLTYRDVLTLYASCDALVSLHRSEGLGLHLMEAMSLGRVVIATAWSGNMDFMGEGDSCLVPYMLVPVESTHPAYAPEVGREAQMWADADIEAAAAIMCHLHEDPAWRAMVGDRAAASMRRRRARVLHAEPIAETERFARELWAAPFETRADHDLRMRRLAALRHQVPGAPGPVREMLGRVKRATVDALRGKSRRG